MKIHRSLILVVPLILLVLSACGKKEAEPVLPKPTKDVAASEAVVEEEVAEIQAEAAEEISEVVEEVAAQLGAESEAVEALKADASQSLKDSLMPKVKFP